MKRIIFVLLTISGLIYYGCKSNPIKNDHYCGLIDSSTIILSVIYPDIKNHIENDLIIFALIKNGEYIPIDDLDHIKHKDIRERDSIFQVVRTFYTSNNKLTSQVMIDSVVNSLLDCNYLRAGRIGSKLNFQKPTIASNFKLPNEDQFQLIDNINNDSLFNKIINDTIFQELKNKFQNLDLKIVKFKDSNQLLCIGNATDSTKAVSNLYFFENEGNSIRLINLLPEELELESWGHGNEFLDYRDIDNDGIPEITLLYHGYESTTIIVYKRVGNKYEKKIENTIFGC